MSEPSICQAVMAGVQARPPIGLPPAASRVVYRVILSNTRRERRVFESRLERLDTGLGMVIARGIGTTLERSVGCILCTDYLPWPGLQGDCCRQAEGASATLTLERGGVYPINGPNHRIRSTR